MFKLTQSFTCYYKPLTLFLFCMVSLIDFINSKLK